MFLVGLVILWAMAFRLRLWSPLLFPSPVEVKDAFVSGLRDGSFQIRLHCLGLSERSARNSHRLEGQILLVKRRNEFLSQPGEDEKR